MLRYLLARVVGMIVMIVLATLVVFLIATQVPADPILAQLGDMQAADEELVAAYRARWGLDLPIWQQYWIFLTGLVQGPRHRGHAVEVPVEVAEEPAEIHRPGAREL